MLHPNLIPNQKTAREALILLDKITEKHRQTLFVHDPFGSIIGSITDGDIRRGLIKGLNIDDAVRLFMNTGFYHFLRDEDIDLKQLKKLRTENIKIIPLLNADKTLHKVINLNNIKSLLPVSVLIMAGGIGSRLKPLTDKTPKPMLPVGEKPIIEHMIDRLVLYGIEDIHISLRHMGEQIIDYFGDGRSKGISINYIRENDPRGTIGAAGMLKNVKHNHIIVQNADLLCNIDYEDLYLFGKNNHFDAVISTFPFQVNIPYAVVHANNHNRVDTIREKPAYTFHSNAGIYLFKTEILDLIPKKVKFDTPDLLNQLLDKGYMVGNFPYIDYWLDIGRREDYLKAQEDIKHIKLHV
ncbi:MAG: sugar phosphate nucleotidyltransferase [Bacteroidales bacterium]|nr:sugar phosphate nucleotidyltransferase [Bacteroidales bacterium]